MTGPGPKDRGFLCAGPKPSALSQPSHSRLSEFEICRREILDVDEAQRLSGLLERWSDASRGSVFVLAPKARIGQDDPLEFVRTNSKQEPA